VAEQHGLVVVVQVVPGNGDEIGAALDVDQGDDDLMIPTKGSHTMAGLIPDARLRIYPDAAHASLFQYPAEAARDVNEFLA
jgi:pimeloyl-ACP methyl ester carboxylesterase